MQVSLEAKCTKLAAEKDFLQMRLESRKLDEIVLPPIVQPKQTQDAVTQTEQSWDDIQS